MKLSDKLRFVRQNMKRHKTRLFMTILAAAMGCGFLIDLASIGFGLQKSIVDEIVGDRLVTQIEVHGKNSGGNEIGEINNDDFAYLSSVPHVKAVTHRDWLQQTFAPVVDGAKGERISAYILDFAAEQKADFALSSGRMPLKSDEALIGPHFRALFMNGNAAPDSVPAAEEWIGKTIAFELTQSFPEGKKTKTFQLEIVGVTKKPAKEWMIDNYLYIDFDKLADIEAFTQTQLGRERLPEEIRGKSPSPETNLPRPMHEVKVYADHMNNVKEIAETIREEGYYNHSIANELENVNLVFFVMKIGLFFVGTIAVLIASIGIYNTMTMAVTERAQDIGIMKAIGAHPKTVRSLFLIESAIIGLSGAVLGTLAAYGISAGANLIVPVIIEGYLHESPPDSFVISHIPSYLAVLCAALSVGVAIFSGMRPARRATRIDVLSALRRDI